MSKPEQEAAQPSSIQQGTRAEFPRIVCWSKPTQINEVTSTTNGDPIPPSNEQAGTSNDNGDGTDAMDDTQQQQARNALRRYRIWHRVEKRQQTARRSRPYRNPF
jgi:hypothetical protein